MSNEMSPLTLREAYDEMSKVKGSYHKNFKTVYKHYGFCDDDPMSDYLEFIDGDVKGWFENTLPEWRSRASPDQQSSTIKRLIKRPSDYPRISELITPEFGKRYNENAKKVLKELTGSKEEGKRFTSKKTSKTGVRENKDIAEVVPDTQNVPEVPEVVPSSETADLQARIARMESDLQTTVKERDHYKTAFEFASAELAWFKEYVMSHKS